MGAALDAIRRQQRRWAGARAIAVDRKDLVASLDLNLFEPLTEISYAEFARGQGDELTTKMRSLISSSALVANVADPMRRRDCVDHIAWAAGLTDLGSTVRRFSFEDQRPTGAGGFPAHPDWVVETADSPIHAVESKFTEPYQVNDVSQPRTMQPAYLEPRMACRWSRLPRSRRLAERIVAGEEKFRRLDAPQLIKHALSLAGNDGSRAFTLTLIWHAPYADLGSTPAEGRAIQKEVENTRLEILRFSEQIDEAITFRALTWSDVFRRLATLPDADTAHTAYLADRYFRYPSTTSTSLP